MKPTPPATDFPIQAGKDIRRIVLTTISPINRRLAVNQSIRLTCSLLLMLLLSAVGLGQSIRGGAVFLQGGPSVWPGSASVIQQVSNTPGLAGNDQYMMIGGEGYLRRNRWLAGINVSTLANKRTQDVATQSVIESSASNVHIWVGWIAWQANRVKLYPGLGPGFNSFNVNSTTANGTTTVRVLDGFCTDLSLTFDWLLQKPDAGPSFAPMVSVRAGYRLTTASAEWHSDLSGTTTLLPTRYTPRGFYLTVGIGGGIFYRR